MFSSLTGDFRGLWEKLATKCQGGGCWGKNSGAVGMESLDKTQYVR